MTFQWSIRGLFVLITLYLTQLQAATAVTPDTATNRMVQRLEDTGVQVPDEARREIRQLLQRMNNQFSVEANRSILLEDSQPMPKSIFIPGDNLFCGSVSFFAGKFAVCTDSSLRTYLLSGYNVGYGNANMPSGSILRLERHVIGDNPPTNEDFSGNYIGVVGEAGYFCWMAFGYLEKTVPEATDHPGPIMRLRVYGVSVAPEGFFAGINSYVSIQRWY